MWLSNRCWLLERGSVPLSSSIQGCVSFLTAHGLSLPGTSDQKDSKAERPISLISCLRDHIFTFAEKRRFCLASYCFLSLLGKSRSPPTRKLRIHPSIVGIPLYMYDIPTYIYLQTIILYLLFILFFLHYQRL